MRYELPQIIFSKIVRAVVEFDLIDDGDRILIGISGGKDSLFLTMARAFAVKKFAARLSGRAERLKNS